MAALIAIAFAFASAFVIPNRLWSSRWFWFSMLTAGVFITSGVSLGVAIRLRIVQKRLLMLLGAHILI